MTDQPVTPDREALETLEAAIAQRLSEHETQQLLGRPVDGPIRANFDDLRRARALLPLLTDAVDRARQQGRDDANRATGLAFQVCASDYEVIELAARLARGADRKAAD